MAFQLLPEQKKCSRNNRRGIVLHDPSMARDVLQLVSARELYDLLIRSSSIFLVKPLEAFQALVASERLSRLKIAVDYLRIRGEVCVDCVRN